MEKLSWVTPTGTIANFLIGISVSVELIAVDSLNVSENLTYNVIGGSLPPGITLSSNGVISGTPVTFAGLITTQTFNFIVRVVSATGAVLDGSFNIVVSNTATGDINWVTTAGDLGTIPNSKYYSLSLVAESNTNLAITYSFVSGELPEGMYLTSNGLLRGVPVFLNQDVVDQLENYRFTIRATNSAGAISDRSFTLTVTDVYGPIIEPTTELLGTFFDGTFFTQQLTVTELNPEVVIEWSVSEGSLPPGITLSNTGLLSGYIQPLELIGAFGPGGFDGDVLTQGVITQQQEYDYSPYDFNELNQSLSYTFTIQAFDGSNYDLQTYIVGIASRVNFTADSTNLANDTYLTSDSKNVYLPVILNATTTLPTGRQDSYYAYKFEGFDFSRDPLTYSIASTYGTYDAGGFDPLGRDDANDGLAGSFDLVTSGNSNLPGLLLDSQTGWLYGKISPQTASLQTFSFGVQASKVRNGITYSSVPVYFSLPILGDVNNIIEWVSSSNLGTINNGTVSEIAIVAKSLVGKELVYSLYDYPGIPARLPQGLKLLPSGDLSGRVSFETFSIDNYDLTFDGGSTTVDRVYTFTVVASDNLDPTLATVSAMQQFTLTLDVIDTKPYENLYLSAKPAFDQRQMYNSVVNDASIFPPELIYRSEDPWFGINDNMKMLFVAGLTPETLDQYETAILHNHWTKKFNFSNISTAVVLDEFYNVKYEVVYINVVDPAENTNGGPAEEINLTGVIANPYIDAEGDTYKIVYPNSSNNMLKRLESNIGFEDRSSLPPWMTSNQPDPNNPGKFTPPIGFIKAVVLAYTVPGASNLIAYRLRNAGISFTNIEFSVDRYNVDNYYTQYFDTVTDKFVPGRETTFDALPVNNIGTITAKVNYAADIPFDQINGRPLDYIIANGGIDGVVSIQNGDTLIFAQQEGFLNPGPYDGWVNYTDSWIGDNILTNTIEGYGGTNGFNGSYDTYSVIPGYLEYIQGTSPVNKRGGVWQINIVNNIVNLSFIQQISPNQRVQIINGTTHSSSIMYYNPILTPGHTVPAYTVYQLSLNAIKIPTTFNAGTTKFFNNRDQYYTPDSQDKYLKFPQHGVFK
jgi:hypothetical protein